MGVIMGIMMGVTQDVVSAFLFFSLETTGVTGFFPSEFQCPVFEVGVVLTFELMSEADLSLKPLALVLLVGIDDWPPCPVDEEENPLSSVWEFPLAFFLSIEFLSLRILSDLREDVNDRPIYLNQE